MWYNKKVLNLTGKYNQKGDDYMKFSCCSDMMYPGLDFIDRVRAAKVDLANAVEFWKWSNKDIDALKNSLDENGIQAALWATSN